MKEGWKYDSFEKCLIKVPKQKAVKSKDYLAEGCFPIVSQESGLVSGYTNNAELVYKHKRPVVIFGDHTKNVKYVDFDFVVGADGVHILYPIDYINPKFLFYEICSIRLRNLGYARHYKLLKEKQIAYPSLSEQERIVELLDAEFAMIDTIRANAEQQLQAAKDLFRSALKEMLTPKEGWKYKPLGEITASINGLWKGKKLPYVNVGVIRNANFTKDFTLNTSNIEYLDVEERQYKSRKLEKGDLIVEKSGGSEKQPVGRTVLFDLDGEFSVSNFTSILRIKDKSAILPAFLYLYLLFVYKEGVTKTMQNAATGIHNIIYDLFLAIPIPILPIGEQQRIVKLLEAVIEKIYSLRSNYDNTITLCNDLKQALLKSIFA